MDSDTPRGDLRTIFPKKPRLKLPKAEYQRLHAKVLQRDGWRCQVCGTAANLHVHHLKSRGRLGDDTAENLITLCSACHDTYHHGRH